MRPDGVNPFPSPLAVSQAGQHLSVPMLTVAKATVTVENSNGEVYVLTFGAADSCEVSRKTLDDPRLYDPWDSKRFMVTHNPDVVITFRRPDTYTMTQHVAPPLPSIDDAANAAHVYAEEHMPTPEAVEISLDHLENMLARAYLAGGSSRA